MPSRWPAGIELSSACAQHPRAGWGWGEVGWGSGERATSALQVKRGAGDIQDFHYQLERPRNTCTCAEACHERLKLWVLSSQSIFRAFPFSKHRLCDGWKRRRPAAHQAQGCLGDRGHRSWGAHGNQTAEGMLDSSEDPGEEAAGEGTEWGRGRGIRL